MIGAHHVDGNREADADVAAGARNDRRVDADELAVQVHERAARVARVDRRVGLNEVLERLTVEAAAPERADDAGRHAVREAERIADRHDVVADAQRRRIAERDARQVRGVDLQHREIRAFVRADDARREAAVLEQRDGDLVGVRDDVMVRQDVAVGGVDDDARARAFDLALARPAAAPRSRRIAAATRLAESAARLGTLVVTAMLTTAGEIASIIGANVGSSRAGFCAERDGRRCTRRRARRRSAVARGSAAS